MQSNWKIDDKLLFKIIIAYCLGIILGSIIVGVIAIYCRLAFSQGVKTFGVLFPFSVGSFFAGFVAQHKGWLMAVILTLLIQLVIYLSPVIFGNGNYDPIIPLRVGWIVGVLFTSVFTGVLGQLLTQWRHKQRNN